MRHRRRTKKLSRNISNRKALFRSLVSSLMVHERISTTYEKAKEASIIADKLITLGKRNTITSKKTAISLLGSKLLINKVFNDIAPRFANRAGGYTRILQLGTRKGDGAKMALLELTERKIVEKPSKKKGAKREEKKTKEIPKKDQRKPKTAEEREEPPKGGPPSEKDKLDEEKKREKARSEKDKLRKSFFKGLRRYFRGKAD